MFKTNKNTKITPVLDLLSGKFDTCAKVLEKSLNCFVKKQKITE